MNSYIYILTDSNRNCLHVGLTDDLEKAAKTYRELTGLFFDSPSSVSRLVYHEVLLNGEQALRRFKELSQYTRMQKERLIRRHNPNWLDLGIASPRSSTVPPGLSYRGRLAAVTSRAQS
ncbi:GIY-YIG nuclease family protein [Parapedobacter sp. 2B3]|uniref:GIY-YIG nuclease family protein n=1 Tax=Parapedobacter sp. 2B3 TaxID=3342381 RepID=UPI0035B5EF68